MSETKNRHAGQPKSRWTATMPTPPKGCVWSDKRRRELVDLLQVVEAGEGTLTITYESDDRWPEDE